MALTLTEFTENDIFTPTVLTSSDNLNSLNSEDDFGFYSWGSSAPTNVPWSATGTLMVAKFGVSSILQIAWMHIRIAIRYYSSGTWTDWNYQTLSIGDTTCSSTSKKTGLSNLSPIRRGNVVMVDMGHQIPAGTYTGGTSGTVLWTLSPKPLRNVHFWGMKYGTGYVTFILSTNGNIYFNSNVTLTDPTYVVGELVYLTDGTA